MSHRASPSFSPTKKSPHLIPPSPQPATAAAANGGAVPSWSGQYVS